jgi:hypothetical protein
MMVGSANADAAVSAVPLRKRRREMLEFVLLFIPEGSLSMIEGLLCGVLPAEP